MRLARELLNFRRVMALGVIGVSILSNLLPAGVAVALAAWVCFLLLIIVYLFDIAYHSIRPRFWSKQ